MLYTLAISSYIFISEVGLPITLITRANPSIWELTPSPSHNSTDHSNPN